MKKEQFMHTKNKDYNEPVRLVQNIIWRFTLKYILK